ncbi:hypothetical protein C5O70_06215, partial [Streptococcus pseudopneumoniae]
SFYTIWFNDKKCLFHPCLLCQLLSFILFENLFKPRQRRLAVGMVTDFVSCSIHNLKTVF